MAWFVGPPLTRPGLLPAPVHLPMWMMVGSKDSGSHWSWGLSLGEDVVLLLRGLCPSASLEEKRWTWEELTVYFCFPAPKDSINKFERQLKIERQVTVMEEKQVIVKQQQETINILMQAQVGKLHGQVDELDNKG